MCTPLLEQSAERAHISSGQRPEPRQIVGLPLRVSEQDKRLRTLDSQPSSGPATAAHDRPYGDLPQP